MSETYGLWEVGGSFVLPGTRKKVTLPFILVGDFSRQAASKALAPIIRDKFHQDLTDRGGHAITTIGDNWALMNLTWRTYQRPNVADPAGHTPKVPIQDQTAAEDGDLRDVQ